MARRKQSGDVNIGSDSFMDVIANIVGILIILIVIAGIRVGRAPARKKGAEPVAKSTAAELTVPTPSTTPDQSASEAPKPPAETAPPESMAETTPNASSLETPAAEQSVTSPKSEESEEPLEPEEPRFVEVTEPPAELEERLKGLRSEIESLETVAATSQAELKDLEARQARGELQIASGKTKLLEEKQKIESTVKSVTQLNQLITSQHASLQLIESQIEDQKKRGPKVKALKHKVTPISRAVSNEQIHVRISKNRISIVPVRSLLESAMRQAKKHASELAQSRTRYDVVGPISGYTMEYKLAAEPASVAEQSRGGPGLYRISLASFKLEPESDLRDESIQEVVRNGSAFDIAVRTAEPGATFTLWVYPESFSSYRVLQARLHELGFIVAGRPLPPGIPISGSPDGSASAGQ